MEIIKQGNMEAVKQNGKDVNVQKCDFATKRFSGEATPHRIAGTHTYTGVFVSAHANIVMPMQTGIGTSAQINTVVRSHASTVVHTHTSTVVYLCSRMKMRVCSGSDARRQTGKQVRKCIYKSIFIHVLKDSKQ
jgi:hypothetical protein